MPIKTTASRSKKSKAEVQEEFDKIKEQMEQEKIEFNPKAEELARQREAEVKDALKEITPEGVVGKISSLGIEVSKMLSELSSKLVAETALLTSLREAVSLEKREIEKLHKMDVSATALDQLIEEHEQRSQALDAEDDSLRVDFEVRSFQDYADEEDLRKQSWNTLKTLLHSC